MSLKTNLIAQAFILVVGTPAAYLVAMRRFRGRSLVLTLIELPLVLPPAVAGIGLLAAFGSRGLLGDELAVLGIRLTFTQVAVVMAIIFVSSPFFLRAGVSAFEAVEADLLAAARTLGASPWRVFRRVALPLALGGLGAAPPCRSPAGWASSGRRSSSRAASPAAPRRCRWRSTPRRTGPAGSRRPSRSARCWSW